MNGSGTIHYVSSGARKEGIVSEGSQPCLATMLNMTVSDLPIVAPGQKAYIES